MINKLKEWFSDFHDTPKSVMDGAGFWRLFLAVSILSIALRYSWDPMIIFISKYIYNYPLEDLVRLYISISLAGKVLFVWKVITYSFNKIKEAICKKHPLTP